MYVMVVIGNLMVLIIIIIKWLLFGRDMNSVVVIMFVIYKDINVNIIWLVVMSFWYWRWREIVRYLFIVMVRMVKNEVDVNRNKKK